MPDIRHVAAPPWEPDLFVAGEFERTAHVWSLSRATEMAIVDTVFDFGGRRLALITGDTPMIVAGAWARHGVCGYLLTGELAWQNKARSAVQHVTALDAGRVAVGYAKGPAVVLDAVTGQELRSLRRVTGVYALTPDISLLESEEHVQLADRELEPTGRRIPLRSFAVLDAAASADHVAVAEANEPLRILDFDGIERAVHVVPRGHVLAVAFDRGTETWRAITRVNRTDDVDYELIRLSDDAEILERRPFDAGGDAMAWLRDGTVLVYGDENGVLVLEDSEAPARRLGDP
jgi:hypothetical protein